MTQIISRSIFDHKHALSIILGMNLNTDIHSNLRDPIDRCRKAPHHFPVEDISPSPSTHISLKPLHLSSPPDRPRNNHGLCSYSCSYFSPFSGERSNAEEDLLGHNGIHSDRRVETWLENSPAQLVPRASHICNRFGLKYCFED